jgi:hypothetical protein
MDSDIHHKFDPDWDLNWVDSKWGEIDGTGRDWLGNDDDDADDDDDDVIGRKRWLPTPPTIANQEITTQSNIIVISCHGATFYADPTEKKLAEMEVKVDTFTTAKFGCPVATYIFDTKNYSFFDEAHTYFIPEILEKMRDAPSPPDKATIRDIITRSLCNTRDQVGLFVQGKCKIKCHKVDDPHSKTMADISIMSPGSYTVEAVLSVDLNTGATKDVHEKFGLELVSPLVTYPKGMKYIDKEYNTPINRAERDLEYLRRQDAFRTEYIRKNELLKASREALRGAVKSANYRYNDAHKSKYVTVTYPNGYTYDMIKLSDVIQIAIDNGTINPKTDFVIVQACRTFDGELPPGTESPGRPKPNAGLSGYESSGGRKKKRTKTKTRPRTKNRNNRNNRNNINKNNTKKRKRKTKTIRRT